MPALQSKSYAMSRFQVKVDGHPITSFVKSVEGGLIKAESATAVMGPHHVPARHLTTRTIEPISMEIGMSGTDWLMDILAKVINKKDHSRVEGEILHADINTRLRFHQGFQRALITEIVLPALDATSKDSAFVKLKIQPEIVTFDTIESGPKLQHEKETKQKLWNVANFRLNLELGGNKINCEHVTKIEAITVKLGTKAHQQGGSFLPEYIPTKLEVSKLGVTLPLHYATDFVKWYRESLTNPGQHQRPAGAAVTNGGYEATGSIEYLDPTCTKILYSINLKGVAMENFTISKTEGSSTNYKSCKVDLYLTEIEVSKAGLGK